MAVPTFRRVRHTPGSARALTAASQPIPDPAVKQFKNPISLAGRMGWQTEAWDLMDRVGELRYYVSWRASSCSKVRMVASELDDEGTPTGKCRNPRVRDIVSSIGTNRLGASQFIKRSVEGLTVPGETFQGIIVDPDGSERWLVFSRDEIRKTGQNTTVTMPNGEDHILSADDSLWRVWNPHPRLAKDCDSPVRACRDALREIVRTTATIADAAKSRLLGAGIVFVPQEMSLPAMDSPAPGTVADPGIALQGVPAMRQLEELIYQIAQVAYGDEESFARMIPVFAGVPGDQIKNVTHLKFDQEFTDTAIKTRNDAIARLALGLDVSPERLLGLGNSSNHWCQDAGTEVLTQNGWVTHDLLSVGDMVLGLDHETGLSTWTPVIDIYRAEVVDEPMLSIETQVHSSLSTAEHRWPVVHVDSGARQWRTSGEGFAKADRIPVAVRCSTLANTPKYSDSFVRLAAAYMSDGSRLPQSRSKTTEYVRIVKFDAAEIADLRAVCYEVFGRHVSEAHHPTRTRDGIAFLFRAGESQALFDITGEHKALHLDFIRSLTEAQLHLFLDALIELGDGVVSQSNARTFFQVEPSRLDAIELAAVLAGYRTTRGQRNQQTGFGTTPLYWLRVGTTRKWMMPYKAKKSWETYTGLVWCPVTGTGTWFARRNGKSFFTGNSAWAIGDNDVQMHIAPVMETICESLTDRILRPMLIGEGIDPAKYLIWYDTSQLTVDPDKSTDATNAFDRGVITADAYREFLGLGATGYDLTNGGLSEWQRWAADQVSNEPTLIATLYPLLPKLQSVDFPVVDVIESQVDTNEAQAEAARNPPQITAAPQADTTNEGNTPNTKDLAPGENQGNRGKKQTVDKIGKRLDGHQDAFVSIFVARALELAGKRRRGRMGRAGADRLRGYKAHKLHRLMGPVDGIEVPELIDGWDDTLEDEVIAVLGIDREEFEMAVRREVRRQLTAAMITV